MSGKRYPEEFKIEAVRQVVEYQVNDKVDFRFIAVFSGFISKGHL